MPPVDRLTALLRERTRFSALHWVASCPSTQDLAMARPRDAAGRFEQAVFWAEHQTAGRGRRQNEWHDEPGADLTVTFRVEASLPAPLALPAAVPVAVALAVEPVAGTPLRIKWPNDLFLDDRKVSGVLIDAGVAGPDTYLIGVGVNCNRVRFPPDLESTATSIALATGHEVDRGSLLLALALQLDRLLRALAASDHRELETAFVQRLGLLGRRVRVDAGERLEGELTAFDFGKLVLDGDRVVPLGAVRSLRGV